MFQYLPLFLILIASCTNTQLPIDLEKTYKMDLGIYTKDKSGSGMIVLPDKLDYSIKVESVGKLDLFIFRSCSREIIVENASHRLDKNEYLINYKRNEIEREPACSVEMQAFSTNRVASWGFIDFEDRYTTLHALVLCGEKEELFNGVSVCQGRVGLLQKIKFNEDVTVKTDCGNIISREGTKTGTEFILELQVGYCVYLFEVDSKSHRLTTYGYDNIFVRE